MWIFFLFKKTTPYCVLNHVFWKASRENQTSLLSRYDTKSHFFAHMIIILRTLMTLPCFNRNNATHSKLTFFSHQDLRDSWWCSLSTLFEIFIFCPKIQLWFPEKNCRFSWGENSWKCCGFGLFSCWQLWFHEKIWQKNFGWKIRENAGLLSKLNFWTKIWLFE